MTLAFVPPEITDDTVPAACRLLGLPVRAFSGADGLDPRLEVLKSLETQDIEACPGSGKTTLLVAKLAILANLWIESRRGLCVLSHTNVARRELEQRLGGTSAGQRLLAYPHFIGTVHSFVNEFLALPWLRSKGMNVEMIDNDVAQRRRWAKLPHRVRAGLEKNRYNAGLLEIKDADFRVGRVSWGKSSLGEQTRTYQAIVEVCRESMQEGYFCHDEMFVWAHDLLDKVPEVVATLRSRFPLLFIDEVQDNSEQQSHLLNRVFMEGDRPVIRQRYGDANQAIYQSTMQQEGATTDQFPIPNYADIPNSFRFDQEIADLADPLAPAPQGLQGKREPREAQAESYTSGKHTVFLFDDESVGYVLENYAAYLAEVFSGNELHEGTFTALSAVHSPTRDDHIPRHVGHYWPDYNYAISRADPQPGTFVEYIYAGRRLSQKSGQSHAFVEKLAEAMVRLIRCADPAFKAGVGKRKHRYILDLMEGHPDSKKEYLHLVAAMAVARRLPTKQAWESEWCPVLKRVTEVITGSSADGEKVGDFLSWIDSGHDLATQNSPRSIDNYFRYPFDSPIVSVRVGSIHAAKGETHTATLVLESYYRAHHLKKLKGWLLGERSGGANASSADRARLKLHYVAMTRPSRLLCLALREDSLQERDIAKLQDCGWRVARVSPEGAEWLNEV